MLTVGSAGADAGRLTLAVQSVDGTGRRTVRELAGSRLSLMPAWHGNDRFTFQSDVGTERPTGGGTRTVYDLTDFPLAPGGPPRTLSRGWPDDLRPAFLDARPRATTEPATGPAVQCRR